MSAGFRIPYRVVISSLFSLDFIVVSKKFMSEKLNSWVNLTDSWREFKYSVKWLSDSSP